MRWLIIAVLICACSPSWHLKQAERHLRKAEIKGAQVRVDTVYKTVTVVVPEMHFDTVLTVQNFRDTITLERDKILTKIKYDTITRRLYVQTICPPDTVKVTVPVSVTKEIKTGFKWWWLIVAAIVGSLITVIKKR